MAARRLKVSHEMLDQGMDLDLPPHQNLPVPPPTPQKFPYYVSAAVRQLHGPLFEGMVDTILEKGVFFNDAHERQKSPFNFKKPEPLSALVNFELESQPLIQNGEPKLCSTKEIGDGDNDSDGNQKLLKFMSHLIAQSPHPSHPFFVQKNMAGLDPYGLVGDWLSVAIQAAVLTFSLSPMYTLMEFEVGRQFRNLLGYPPNEGDAAVTPGQGIGNSYAMQLALQAKFKDVKQKGWHGIANFRPTFFVSQLADSCFEKLAVWQGIGMEACVRVKVDFSGRMDLIDLEMKINEAEKNGFSPFLVVATAGDSILGAIDPIDQIFEVTQKKNLWLHVDGHLAGSCCLSANQRDRLKGIERSDSCLWSPSKMLAAPSTMTILFTRKRDKMRETFSVRSETPQVFNQEPYYNHRVWDNGDHSMQATRRPSIMKIWFMWKAKGLQGLANQVDGTYKNAAIALTQLKERAGNFKLILENFDCYLVSFYYVPKSIRKWAEMGRHGEDRIVEILKRNKITEGIKARLLERGVMAISVECLNGAITNGGKEFPPFFLMNLNNTALTEPDIIYLVDQIEYHGDQFVIEHSSEIELDENEENFLKVDTNSIRPPPTVPPPPSSYPDHVSAPIQSMHGDLFRQFFKLILDTATFYQDERESSPFDFVHPEILVKKFDFSLALNSSAAKNENENDGYKSVEELMRIVKDIIKFSPKLAHPYYMFQIINGSDPFTLMADYMVSTMTSPMLTYEDGPMYFLMEDHLFSAVRTQLLPPSYKDGDNLMIPGGAMANEIVPCLAYIKKFPGSKHHGHLGGHEGGQQQGVIFTSAAGHNSTIKATFFLGLGMENCILVKVDDSGRMIVTDLEEKIQEAVNQGKIPVMVVATAGTNIIGSMDSISDISVVCKKYNIWLHVDGAYGGPVIFSKNHSPHYLQGIEDSDSFTFNGHKMFGGARSMTVLLTRHPGLLNQAFSKNDPSPQRNKWEPHVLTDRRAEVFKFWLLWKAKGTNGLTEHIDRIYELTDDAHKKLLTLSKETSERFTPLLKTPPQCCNINFLYVPARVREFFQKKGGDSDEKMKEVISYISNTIMAKILLGNQLVVAVEPFGTKAQSLIFCLSNSSLNERDVDYFFQLIEYHGGRLNLDTILNHFK